MNQTQSMKKSMEGGGGRVTERGGGGELGECQNVTQTKEVLMGFKAVLGVSPKKGGAQEPDS